MFSQAPVLFLRSPATRRQSKYKKVFMYQYNNPGNLRYVGEDNPFLGEIRPNQNRTWREFATMQHGFRAMAVLLNNYYKMGKRTFRQMMHTYAPFGDGSNNPDNYANKVAAFAEFNPDEDFARILRDERLLFETLYKMAHIENGSWPDAQDALEGAQMFQGTVQIATPTTTTPTTPTTPILVIQRRPNYLPILIAAGAVSTFLIIHRIVRK